MRRAVESLALGDCIGMRVLWTHNFDPSRPNSQVYMNVAAAGVRALGVDLHCEYLGNLRSVGNLVRARARVRSMSADFDVVHAQYGSACSLASATSVAPTVLSLRGNDWSVHNDRHSFRYVHTRLARAMTRASIGAFDRVLTVSRRMGLEVTGRYPKAVVETFPSPIDLERFVPRDRAAGRALLGFPANAEKWILFNAIDLADAVKRFPLAKAAFELAQRRRGDLRLRLATGLNHAEVPLFAATCDLILCTSETEGWPNSVKEALACDVPFVSTDVSDLRDIAQDEPACRICAAEPKALARGILEALEATQRPLRHYVEWMSLDTACRRLVALYEGLLTDRTAAGGTRSNSGD